MDLTQAEAVCDVIHATSERASKTARAQLDGALSRPLNALYDELMNLNAEVEHLLDFDEGELPPRFEAETCARLQDLSRRVGGLLATWHEGRLLREGALVVICGKPNAGKSSLMNALVGYDRAIVNAQAGTTRDVIEEHFDLEGILVRLIDTAGLREADCDIEREGVARARAWIDRADVVVYVVDSGIGIDPEEDAFIATLPAARRLLVLNKNDLAENVKPSPESEGKTVSVSLLESPETARREICAELRAILGITAAAPTAVAVNRRHYSELILADEQLSAARQQFETGALGWVPAAGHIRAAAEAIGRMLGRSWSSDLLERVFSRFCVGK